MATDIMQVSSVGNTTASPTVATFPIAPKAGNLIVAGFALTGTPTVPTLTSISDNLGNSYVLASVLNTGTMSLNIYSAVSVGGTSPLTITVAWSGGSGPRTLVFAAEYSGPWPSTLVDATGNAPNGGTASVSYGLTTKGVPDLVVSINAVYATANWSGLSGVDRSGVTGIAFEYNDILQAVLGTTTITATSSATGVGSLSVGFFTQTEPGLVATYKVDDLLTIMNDELHGKKNAFSESQKIRHLNKGLDELWKIMKLIHGGYWLTNNTPGLVLDQINTDFLLPTDFAEMRLIEVTNPVDYVGIDVIQMPMTSALFKNERQSFRAFQTVATADSVLAIPGQLNYDIYGPDASNKMHILFSRPAPVPLTLLLWYIRMVGHFSVPKDATQVLQSVMSPYIWNLCVYAAKSLLKSESNDAQEFAKWEEQWSKEIDRAMPAAHERATADEQSVEGFAEM